MVLGALIRQSFCGKSADVAAHHGYEADAATGSAAKVVGQADLWILDLPRARLTPELEPHFVHHA